VLVGPSDVPGNQRVYVGEADVLRTRLDQQHANRDFWTRAVAFTAKDTSLNKAHVKYLESRLVQLGHEARRDVIENGNVPRRPALSEAETADMEAFLDDMLVIYPVLDVRAFERVEVGTGMGRLRLVGPDAYATGDDKSEGFLVRAGSRARRAITASTPTSVGDLRTRLVQTGVLLAEGDGLRFASDYLFDSPSAAASVVLGRSANGRTEWKDENGKTLKQIQTHSVAIT
jgi:hypothetical protein